MKTDDWLRELVARRGLNLDEVLTENPEEDLGWVLADGPAHRRELTERHLSRVAAGQFQPGKLPPLDSRVAKWIEVQQRALLAHDRTNEAPFLILAGATGSGKTSQAFHIIISLAQFAAEKGVPLRWKFASHRELNAQTRGMDAVEEVVRDFKTVDLLVWDDLGDQHQTGWSEDCAARVLHHRDQYMLPTVFTTNLPIERTREIAAVETRTGERFAVLADAYSDRVISRLKTAWYISMGNTDHRQGKGRVLR